MARRGGYQLIDFKGTKLTVGASNGSTIPGIYDMIEGDYCKQIIATGINIAGTDYNDVAVVPALTQSKYTFSVYGHTFTIDSDDLVTVVTSA